MNSQRTRSPTAGSSTDGRRGSHVKVIHLTLWSLTIEHRVIGARVEPRGDEVVGADQDAANLMLAGPCHQAGIVALHGQRPPAERLPIHADEARIERIEDGEVALPEHGDGIGLEPEREPLVAGEQPVAMVEIVGQVALERRPEIFDDDETRWRLERAVERSQAREHAQGRPFSRRAVNARLGRGEHRELMHQQC
jgi:hypothetical protein